MPVVKNIKSFAGTFHITQNFSVGINGSPGKRIFPEATRFIRRLGERTGIFYDKLGFITPANKDTTSSLVIFISRPGLLKLKEDESYELKINTEQIVIRAQTDIGAIRAFETLMQLVSVDDSGYFFPAVEIQDAPRFAWRGLLLDVALHFMPVDVIKRTLDGMAAVKMNVLHLHLCNDQGFRVQSKVFPQLNAKASEGQYYTQEEIRNIVQYAGQRGIRIVPEFVVPSHTTAILTAFPDLASEKRQYGLERYFGVFDPVLDPTNPKVYVFLDKLFTEMMSLFPDQYFHIGGDENTGKHWENNAHIKAYMHSKKMNSYMDLQTEFNRKILGIIKKNGKKMMGWDEILQPGVPKDIVIQSWRGRESFYESVKKGYPAILSYGYYIDLIQHADYHYSNDPIPDSVHLSIAEEKLVLGGEATMWSELVTPETVDSRIWPRLAVIAERLWSPHEVNDVDDMYRRMRWISLYLETVGLKHLTYREAFMRRLANSYDYQALDNLLQVIEPLKIYERNSGDTLYTVFSPMTKIADAAIPDPELPRWFATLVEKYLSRKSSTSEKEIRDQLGIWKGNHEKFLLLLDHSPVLKEGELLSENLSKIAECGIKALDLLKEGNGGSKEWLADQQQILSKARTSAARCELQVIVPIEKLVFAASKENVKSFPSFGNLCSLW
jgi:hexosaminidase